MASSVWVGWFLGFLIFKEVLLTSQSQAKDLGFLSISLLAFVDKFFSKCILFLATIAFNVFISGYSGSIVVVFLKCCHCKQYF